MTKSQSISDAHEMDSNSWLPKGAKAAVSFKEQVLSVTASVEEQAASAFSNLRVKFNNSSSASDDTSTDSVDVDDSPESEPSSIRHLDLASYVVHSSSDGAEVMLAADADRDSSDTAIEETTTMHLKILRGKDLQANKPYCRVYADETEVGVTPVREETSNPIFGGPPSTFRIEGTKQTKVIIQVLDRAAQQETPTGQVEFIVSEVLCQQNDSSNNPNTWLHVMRDIASYEGSLQIRLVPTQLAPLQPQPSARVLQAGPELPRFDSYAIRKLVMCSTAPVTLNVYDVSNNHKIADLNYYVKAIGAGGIFHAAIEIYGREFSFGGSRQDVCGIFASPSKRCPVHHYRESIFLGDCELTKDQIKCILKQMEPDWRAQSYNIFRKNCCFFSKEFAIELGVGTIPTWVYSLAETAEPLEPYIMDYMKRKNAKQKAAEKDKESKPQDMQDNVMVDHAMAARLQRTYRKRRVQAQA